MVDSIAEQWEEIKALSPTLKNAESTTTVVNAPKKMKSLARNKIKKSQTTATNDENDMPFALYISWWTGTDEKVIIHFKNGNKYEGWLSRKMMHGEGRFQWSNGTIFLGEFEDNKMVSGRLQWKDDCWYEGGFSGNVRHGKGIFVNSRKNQYYIGEWYNGCKQGDGMIKYSPGNTYDGAWKQNKFNGYGVRHYCKSSGYQGEWQHGTRIGKSIMVWPNHDYYRGFWNKGIMHGFGLYVWNACANDTMTKPMLNFYQGYWNKGRRDGCGTVFLGFEGYYFGLFKDNTKHGPGRIVTMSGEIMDNVLFNRDLLTYSNPLHSESESSDKADVTPPCIDCAAVIGLRYHIENVVKNFDMSCEVNEAIINQFLSNNSDSSTNKNVSSGERTFSESGFSSYLNRKCQDIENFVYFEETALRKMLQIYIIQLSNIYCHYANVYTTEETYFPPLLTRLYMWQFYYDIDLYHLGLTLIDVDNMLFENKMWLFINPHNPFETIYFWQFQNSLIAMACRLYCMNQRLGRTTDTIVAHAFQKFMEKNVLPNVGKKRGHLGSYGRSMPLVKIYDLYRTIGEPHTIRQFINAVVYPTVDTRMQRIPLIVSDEHLPFGHNAFHFGESLSFVTDNKVPGNHRIEKFLDLPLYCFGNLSCYTIIKIFSHIFPEILHNKVILNLEIKLTFFEFFEAFINCAIKSVNVDQEEVMWRKAASI